MNASIATRSVHKLAAFILGSFLAGCTVGEGDGPQPISSTPATLPPTTPVDTATCDTLNFEDGCPTATINNFNGGATTVIDNPVIGGINVSAKVARMQKFPDEVFGGTKLDLPEGRLDFTAGEFFKLKVWSPRSVPVTFKLEEQNNPAGGFERVETHTGGSEWQELCYDMTAQNVPTDVTSLTIIFDITTLGAANTDVDNWTFYYDEILQVQSCEDNGGTTPVSADVKPLSGLFTTAGESELKIPDDYSELSPLNSGSIIDPFYSDDATFSPALSVFSGTGDGSPVAKAGFIGFAPGFFGSNRELVFKVKGLFSEVVSTKSLPNQVILICLLDANGEDALRINLTSSGFAALLENDWFQVRIPLSRFDNAATATSIVFESDNSAVEQFRMLLTDIGFGVAGDSADPGLTPDAGVLQSDATADNSLAPPGFDNFGSGAAFDAAFTGEDFDPALQVVSGEGYGAGTHVGFVAFTGYSAGFASSYETLTFKVKGDAANIAAFEVKFFAPDTTKTYDLTTYDGVTDLGNGWLQVSIPMSDFAANIDANDGFLIGPLGAQAAAFSILYADIGFSGTAGGDSADPGLTPDAGVLQSDATADNSLAPPGFDNFGSGAAFDAAFTGEDFDPALQVVSGEGYGAGTHVGFVAFTGYSAGFASSYETLTFKVKGDAANIAAFEVKFFAPDTTKTYDLTTYDGVTDLGNGWLQVSIPMSDFAANIDANDGFLIGPLGAQAAAFSILYADIGFSGTAGGDSADPGLTPDAGVLQSDATADNSLAPPGFDNFGSGAAFDAAFTGEDFDPALQVVSGEGYGAGTHVGFVAFTGYSAGFASSYETLTFKVKGDAANIAAFEVKFFAPDTTKTYDLTTYDGVTDLGNGWLQVSIPMSDFAANIDANDGFLIGPLGAQAAAFSILYADIGFSGTAGGDSADPGLTPDAGVLQSDATADNSLAPPGFDNFGSGAAFDAAFTGEDFDPALQVVSGEGYGAGTHVGFVAFTGYSAGFASSYETLTFKVKGDAANIAAFEVKFFAPDTTKTYDLTTYDGVTDLGNGWLQVSIPMSDFAANIDANDGFLIGPLGAQAAAFSILYADIGFSGTAGGDSADPGLTPDAGVLQSDATADNSLAPPGFDNFGSGAAFDAAFTGEDFDPALQVVSGEGYGAGTHVGFVAFTGYSAGFASSYETLTFKVKGDAANIAAFEVKFFAPDTTKTYDLTTYDGVTDLGNGWLQVSIPMSDFAANIDANDGFLIGPLGAQAAAFSILYADIGFSGTAGGDSADPGLTPDAGVLQSDATADNSLAPPGFDNFGSGAAFDAAFTGEDFDPALQVVSGEGYGAGTHVGFVAFTGYSAGFASSYETLTFKVKGDAANIAAFEVKFFAPDTTKTYDLTTYDGVTDLGNGWLQVSIPMSDFAANIDANDGFLIGPLGAQAAAFSILYADIGFSGTATVVVPVDPSDSLGLAANSDFETGDFDGWETFTNSGSVIISTPGASGGSAANLNVTVPGNPTLKQIGIGAGMLTTGQTVDITFDWKGTTANGAIIDVRVFSERSEGNGGGVTKTDIISDGPQIPSDWTTVGPVSITTAADDVSGGLTIQFTAICGGDAGCVSDLFVDNVTITGSGN